ncbi:MAG: ATP-binding protein [Clostridia bacterium]|nr:ATP-binding protein [Clostridia bacterium]
MANIDELIVYRDLEDAEILNNIAEVMNSMNDFDGSDESRKIYKNKIYSSVHKLVEFAGTYGFEKNLWQNYLTLLLVNNENVFSKACEIRGIRNGTLLELAMHDFLIFRELFSYDFKQLGRIVDSSVFDMILNYKRVDDAGKAFNKRIRDCICELSLNLARSKSIGEFAKYVIEFYRRFGVGKLGLHKAFRIAHDSSGVHIVPITNIAHVNLDDLVGYESAKQKLTENTEAFLNGERANNCLLFGDAGTGKSSSIKAILNKYYEDGLRIIEVYKHQFQDLNDVIAQIKNRSYKFIIYMDDLSFEEFEVEYKYLKAVIEGGLEKKPQNVLIYATSNRRHLIKENFSDRDGWTDNVHKTDTVQEKLSLAARFGVTIYFGSPDKKQFQNIVKVLAERNDLNIPEDKLLLEANRWELQHGGLSGRTAQQFIDYLLGKQALS